MFYKVQMYPGLNSAHLILTSLLALIYTGMLHHVSFSTLWLPTCPRAYRLLPTDYSAPATTLTISFPWSQMFPGFSIPYQSVSAHFCAILHQSPLACSLPVSSPNHCSISKPKSNSASSVTPPSPPLTHDVICNSCPGGASGKNVGDLREVGSVSGWGRSPGEGNGNLPQYLCLENLMGRGA